MDTNNIKASLQALLARTTEDLEQFAIQNPETGDWEVRPDQSGLTETDENSAADAAEESEERQSTLAELETTFRHINLALQKIESGTYGACELCLAPIEAERLSFLPTARTCATHRDDERTLPL
jgi:RNA polymerase-binding transcription factor DksA